MQLINLIKMLLTQRVVAEIDISFKWSKSNRKVEAKYCLTETIFGTRSWFLRGNISPARPNIHPLFSQVQAWVKTGEIGDRARLVVPQQNDR